MTTPPAPTATRYNPAAWAPPMFVAATLLGVLMRFGFLGWRSAIAFDHLLHAHSHTLYFGWAGLAVLTLIVTRQGWAMAVATWGVPVMALTFLWGGYAPVSIAASTIMMFAWYVLIWQWWRDTRKDSDCIAVILRTAFVYVIIASFGIWALAAFKATGVGEPLSSRVAIHSFLSNFAWFFLFGTVAMAVRHRLIVAEVGRRVVVWWAGLAWLTFPLGVSGGTDIRVLGVASRLAVVALIYPTWLLARGLWESEAGVVVRWAAGWLLLKAFSDVALAIGGDDLHKILGRQGVVIYLHVMLLGYVTTMFAWYLARTIQVDVDRALLLHQFGTIVMLIGIGLPFAAGAGPAGLWISVIGAVMVWSAGLGWALPIWSRRPHSSVIQGPIPASDEPPWT